MSNTLIALTPELFRDLKSMLADWKSGKFGGASTTAKRTTRQDDQGSDVRVKIVSAIPEQPGRYSGKICGRGVDGGVGGESGTDAADFNGSDLGAEIADCYVWNSLEVGSDGHALHNNTYYHGDIITYHEETGLSIVGITVLPPGMTITGCNGEEEESYHSDNLTFDAPLETYVDSFGELHVGFNIETDDYLELTIDGCGDSTLSWKGFDLSHDTGSCSGSWVSTETSDGKVKGIYFKASSDVGGVHSSVTVAAGKATVEQSVWTLNVNDISPATKLHFTDDGSNNVVFTISSSSGDSCAGKVITIKANVALTVCNLTDVVCGTPVYVGARHDYALAHVNSPGDPNHGKWELIKQDEISINSTRWNSSTKEIETQHITLNGFFKASAADWATLGDYEDCDEEGGG